MSNTKHPERGKSFLRTLDMFIGVPLCCILGIFRYRKRKITANPITIGVIIFGAIGDAILASSILLGLRHSYPKAKLILFLSSSNQGVSSLLPEFDEIYITDVKRAHKTIGLLRDLRIDLLIDTTQWARLPALISFFSGAKYTVGFKSAGQFRHTVYDTVVNHSNSRHELDNFKELIAVTGSYVDVHPRIKSIDNFNFIKYNITKPYIVFHPWAAGYKSHLREWPVEQWVNLAKTLISRNISIVITGGSEDRVRSLELKSRLKSICPTVCLAGEISLLELTGCLQSSSAVISVNTGVMHMASLLGCAVISLNGPTNSLRWGGIGPNTYNVNIEKIDGGAYLNLGFEYPRNALNIMHKIKYSEVSSILLTKILK